MKKKSVRFVAILLSLFMAVSLLPAAGITVEAAAKPGLAKKAAGIVVGGTTKIKVKNAPKKAKITYKSAKKNIATVSKKGNVKGIKSGTTKITVFVKKGSKTTKLTYKITVKKPQLKGTLSLDVGETADLSIKNKPKKAEYTWNSSNPEVAAVNENGKITAKAKGTATIQAAVKTTKKTYHLSCKVTVDSKSNDPESLSNFTADEVYWIAGQNNDITFTVEGSNIHSPVILCNDKDEQIAEMHDDGVDGDVTAGDGIYTSILASAPNAAKTETYYASAGSASSNNIEIFYFEQPTEETKTETMEIQQQLDSVDNSYADENGFIQSSFVDDVMAKADEYAKNLYENGDAIFYESSENCVSIKLSSGLSIAYVPRIEGRYSISNETDMSVCVYQPYYNWVSTLTDSYISLPKDVDQEALLLNAAATAVENSFNNYSFTTHRRDENVSLDTVKEFGSNQIILWQGHGAWIDSSKHSVLLTGSAFNWDAWWWDAGYWWDCVQDRIVNVSGSESFSSKYVDKYCGSLDNSVIYLGPCEGGYDDVLAQSFLGKGAAAVIANSKSILCLYGDIMQYTTVFLMTQINPDTNNYYTLGEALSQAKTTYGKDDAAYGGSGAEPLLFGGAEANDYRLADVHRNDDKNIYQAFAWGMTWEEANEYCQSIGGHLATITSQQEQNYIESILPDSKEYYWLGGKRLDNSPEQWSWITEESFDYTNWAQGQPDNGYGDGEKYLGITTCDTSYANAFQWNDYTNEGSASSLSNAGFICEWETSN